MEKIIKMLVPEKTNPLGESEPDLSSFIKNVMYIFIAGISIAYTAGNYLSVAKQLPARITATEAKIDGLERKQEVAAVQLTNISSALTSIQVDVREIRAAQMRVRDPR